MDDWNLLQQYVADGSADALDELVRRHTPMVYAAALRQLRDPHLAEDVTQAVFIILMRQAGRISRGVVLGGWLFNVTRFAAAKARRSEMRRRKHEANAAAATPTVASENTAGTLDQLSPLLNDAVASLRSGDRDAVVMKYLQGKSSREVADAQQVSEDAARKRINRAVGKLRAWFARKKIVVTADSLEAAMTGFGASRMPTDLAVRVTAALHGSTAGASLTIAELTSKVLIMAKLKTIAAACIAIVLIIAAGGVFINYVFLNQPHPSIQVSAIPSPANPAPIDLTRIGPGETPTATLVGAFNAAVAGNGDMLIACFDQLTPDDKAALRHAAHVMGFAEEFRAAVASRWGEAEALRLMQSAGMHFGVSREGMKNAVAVINGDTATVRVQPMGQVPMVRVGNLWKMSGELMKGAPITEIAMMDAAIPLFREFIVAIKAGQFQTIQDVRLAMRPVIQDAVNPGSRYDPPARPAVLGPNATPKETIAALHWASQMSDADAAIGCFDNPSAEKQEQIRNSVLVSHAGAQLRTAIAAKFGGSVGQESILTLGIASPISKTSLDAAPEHQTGDTARVDIGLGIGHIDLMRSNGLWKIDPNLYPKPNMAWLERMQDHYVPLLDSLTADVNDGKFTTQQQLQTEIRQIQKDLSADYRRMFPPATTAAR